MQFNKVESPCSNLKLLSLIKLSKCNVDGADIKENRINVLKGPLLNFQGKLRIIKLVM